MNERQKNTIILCFAGLDAAGKTSLIKFTQEGDFVRTFRTMGMNIENIHIRDLFIRTYDLGGQILFRKDWDKYLPHADVVAYVIDATDQERFQESKDELERVIRLSTCPMVVMLNKQDLEEASLQEELESFFDFTTLFTGRKWMAVETSAITAQGLFDAFKWIYETTQEEELKVPSPYSGFID